VEPVTKKAEKTVSWLQQNMLGVVTALLALVVFVVAWLLRRGGGRRDDANDATEGVITEAMIKDKLENIDLNLGQADTGTPDHQR
jgi:pilus assembly protein FimV